MGDKFSRIGSQVALARNCAPEAPNFFLKISFSRAQISPNCGQNSAEIWVQAFLAVILALKSKCETLFAKYHVRDRRTSVSYGKISEAVSVQQISDNKSE